MRNTNKVKIIPLGGLHEIGKNLTLVEYRDDRLWYDFPRRRNAWY